MTERDPFEKPSLADEVEDTITDEQLHEHKATGELSDRLRAGREALGPSSRLRAEPGAAQQQPAADAGRTAARDAGPER